MRIPLINGDYQARSVIASAQRCVNLYAEKNPKDSLTPFTFYSVPGLTLLGTPPTAAAGRGLYWANSDALYGVVGNTLYSIGPPPTWTFTALGTINYGTSIVSMADNGTDMVLVDGTANGYEINLASNSFTPISSANNSPPVPEVFAFYGGTRVDILDGFMVLNQPGTQSFYATYDNEIVFDSLWFAEKNGYSDKLVSVIVTRRELWLIGERTAEIWFDAGASPLPFQIMPGPFIQHGCSAVYSVAQIDGAVFWLSQDQAGNNVLLRGEGYLAREISTPALTNEWNSYSTTADAQGFCFQQGGHPFYQINFPTADASWRWDSSTQLWHEAVYTDSQGYEHRHRASCAAYAYGVNVCLDWQNGNLYQIDPNNITDNNAPMFWRRGFPHIMNDGKRLIYPAFTLDVEAATAPATPPGLEPIVNLRWSDTRGRTWEQPVPQTLGATGKYYAQPKWSRCGMGRDRVFECYGVVPGKLAINGAFLEQPITLGS
jgi:hypothetical protein